MNRELIAGSRQNTTRLTNNYLSQQFSETDRVDWLIDTGTWKYMVCSAGNGLQSWPHFLEERGNVIMPVLREE